MINIHKELALLKKDFDENTLTLSLNAGVIKVGVSTSYLVYRKNSKEILYHNESGIIWVYDMENNIINYVTDFYAHKTVNFDVTEEELFQQSLIENDVLMPEEIKIITDAVQYVFDSVQEHEGTEG